MQLVLLSIDKGQETRTRPRRRKPCLSLTPAQAARLRLTLKNLYRAYGSWQCLAEVMGVAARTLQNIVYERRPGAPSTAAHAARAAGIPVEQLLSGSLSVAGRCPHCGRDSG
jgi:hypothetical protein